MNEECFDETNYNLDFVNKNEFIIRYFCMALNIMSLICALLVYKWR